MYQTHHIVRLTCMQFYMSPYFSTTKTIPICLWFYSFNTFISLPSPPPSISGEVWSLCLRIHTSLPIFLSLQLWPLPGGVIGIYLAMQTFFTAVVISPLGHQISLLPTPPRSWQPPLSSLGVWLFLDSTYSWDHTVFMSLSIKPSRSTHAIANVCLSHG